MQTAHSPLPRSNFYSSPSNAFCNSRSTKCILTTESLWRTDLVESCRNFDLSVPSGTVRPASLPGEASSSPSPLWTLNRRHWRGSAYERAHSLLPTEFIKFFFFSLPVWPVFLSLSSSHLPSPRSASFRMPFDRWKMVHEAGSPYKQALLSFHRWRV